MKTRLIRLLFIFVLILCIGCTQNNITQAKEESHVQECINDAMKHSKDGIYYSYMECYATSKDFKTYEIHVISDYYIDSYLYTITYESNSVTYNRTFMYRIYFDRS